MRWSVGKVLLPCVLFTGWPFIQGTASGQAADPRLERIFAEWRKRQEATKSAFYRVAGTRVIAKGSFLDPRGRPLSDTPPRDIKSNIHRTFLLDFATNRFRLEVTEEDYDSNTDKLYPKNITWAYDGTHIKLFRPRDKNTHPVTGVRQSDPEIGVGSGYLDNAPIASIHWPFFVGHGIVPTRDEGIRPGRLKVLPEMDLMYIHGQTVHRGKTCLVLRTSPGAHDVFDEWWVDLASGGSVVRQLVYAKGKAQWEADIEYQKTSHGWLPHRWSFTERNFNSGNVMYVERLAVREVRLDQPLNDSDFTIEEKPGMRITEYLHEVPSKGNAEPPPKTKLYLVGADGRRELIADNTGQGYGLFWFGGGLIVVAISLGVVIWRRRARSVT
jgi:hypothetical protein